MCCRHVLHACAAGMRCMHALQACAAGMCCRHALHACAACMCCRHVLQACAAGMWSARLARQPAAAPALHRGQRSLVGEVVRPLYEPRVARLHPAAAQVVAVHTAERPPLVTLAAVLALAERGLSVHVLAHVPAQAQMVAASGYTYGVAARLGYTYGDTCTRTRVDGLRVQTGR